MKITLFSLQDYIWPKAVKKTCEVIINTDTVKANSLNDKLTADHL